MPRLPLADRASLLAELDLIELEREQIHAQTHVVNPGGRQNRLDSLDEWEADLREQLEEMRP